MSGRRFAPLILMAGAALNAQDGFRLVLDGQVYTRPAPDLAVEVTRTPAAFGNLRKTLRIRPRNNALLEHVDIEWLAVPPGARVTIARGERSGALGPLPICAFVERGGEGRFYSLDFAAGEIDSQAGRLAVGYSPYVRLRAGEVYESHAVTSGAYLLSGRKLGPYDQAAAGAFRRYVRFDYAIPHLLGPQLIYTSIVNRFTEIDSAVPPAKPGETPVRNTIFYTLSDANYYMLRPEKIPEEIDFAKSLSMEWCQLYEGPFEWIPGTPAAAVARRIGEYARDRGMRLGLYTGANHLTAPHFNHYAQDKGRAEWKMMDADGRRRAAYCWGSDDFAGWFTGVLIAASLEFNFRQANFDFLEIAPCYDTRHGHPPGEKGLYRQVFNLVRMLRDVRRSAPGYTYDSNLGWPPFVPKIAPWMDGFYLNDPHFTVYFPSLNSVEALDNSRRYEMVSYFLNYLTPVEYFRNCEYFVTGDSVLHDANVFEYGILQGLAVTPNLQLGEARALFDRLSPADQERARRFLARWTAFVKTHWEYYANTIPLTGLPKLGQVEIYAHAKDDRSLVFLVNPNPFEGQASFRFDGTIGLTGTGPYQVRELYPEERLVAGAGSLEMASGEVFDRSVPARTVVVLEIGPPPRYANPPLRIAGAVAACDRFADHYRIEVEGWQGETRSVRLFPPDDEALLRVESGGAMLPMEAVGGGFEIAVRFPKERVIADVSEWTVGANPPPAAGQALHLPQFQSDTAAANFLGARVENLLNERFSRELLVYFEPRQGPRISKEVRTARTENPAAPPAPSGLEGRQFWYTSRFPIAYVQRYIPPPPDRHNYISLNFKKPENVAEIKAWLNDREAAVERYHQWRGPAGAFTFYIDGTRSGLKRGDNLLRLFVRYR